MKQFGFIAIAITLFTMGCTRQEMPAQEDSKSSPVWAEIPLTEDRILMLIAAGPVREAVVDVKWDESTRQEALAGGFSRAAEAVNTRAVYRFNCQTGTIQTQSYTILSERGETLLAQANQAAKETPVDPGSKGARYLAAACGDAIRPKMLQRLDVK